MALCSHRPQAVFLACTSLTVGTEKAAGLEAGQRGPAGLRLSSGSGHSEGARLRGGRRHSVKLKFHISNTLVL